MWYGPPQTKKRRERKTKVRKGHIAINQTYHDGLLLQNDMKESVPIEERAGFFTQFTMGNREDKEITGGLKLDDRETELVEIQNIK